MIKHLKRIFGISVLTLLIIVTIIFNKDSKHYKHTGGIHTVHPTYVDDSYFIPGYGKSYIGFKENLAYRESRGKYSIINSLGYMGKYQFGPSTLAALKVKDTSKFLNSPKIQEKVFKAYLSKIKYLLSAEIEQFSGKEIRGIVVTESGILAAAHLAGVESVKKFLYSNGKLRAKDAYGTRIEYYIRDFADYDLSLIDADPNPKH